MILFYNGRYVVDFEEQMSSKGKSPWITINGVDVADSQLAIDYLTKNLNKVNILLYVLLFFMERVSTLNLF